MSKGGARSAGLQGGARERLKGAPRRKGHLAHAKNMYERLTVL